MLDSQYPETVGISRMSTSQSYPISHPFQLSQTMSHHYSVSKILYQVSLPTVIIVYHSRWLACISNSKIMLSYGSVKYIFLILFYFCFFFPCKYLFISLDYIPQCTTSNSCEGHFKCLWMTIDEKVNSKLTLLFKLSASLALILCEHIENLVLLYFH